MVRELARPDQRGPGAPEHGGGSIGPRTAGAQPSARPGRRRPRPVVWLQTHAEAADGLIALALVVLGLVGLVVDTKSTTRTTPVHAADALAVVLIIGQAAPLVWRRRYAVEVLAASTAAIVTYQIIGYADTPATLATLIAAYSVGAHVTRRRALWSAGALLVTLTTLNAVGVYINRPNASVWDAIGNWIIFGTAFILGDNMRRRRQRIADLEDRAAALERERGLEADRAVGRERARIARELHDIVAHALSIMVVQSGAARRVLATQPALATEALVNVEATGREALVEMRRLLGVLRAEDDTTQLAPQPSLHRLDELIASSELLVTLSVEGDPQPISPAVELSAYRIVQEALTNVRKHAGPATTEVHVQYRPDVIVLAVLDDGRGASAALHAAATTTGHGLMGMRERVSLCGGQLRVGPRPGGGWSVHAELPYATTS